MNMFEFGIASPFMPVDLHSESERREKKGKGMFECDSPWWADNHLSLGYSLSYLSKRYKEMLVDCEEAFYLSCFFFCFLSVCCFSFLNLLFEICMRCSLSCFSVTSLLALASVPTSLAKFQILLFTSKVWDNLWCVSGSQHIFSVSPRSCFEL